MRRERRGKDERGGVGEEWRAGEGRVFAFKWYKNDS